MFIDTLGISHLNSIATDERVEELLRTRLAAHSMFASSRLLEEALQARNIFKETRTLLEDLGKEIAIKLKEEKPALQTAITEYHKRTNSQSLILGLTFLSSSDDSPQTTHLKMQRLATSIKARISELEGITAVKLLNSDIPGDYFEVLKYCLRDTSEL